MSDYIQYSIALKLNSRESQKSKLSQGWYSVPIYSAHYDIPVGF